MRKLMFIRTSQVLMCGMVEIPDIRPTHDTGPITLHYPRMVFINHETQEITLAPHIGSPTKLIMERSAMDFSYLNEDEETELFYKAETVEPKTEVIQ
jgi:hypothetical protein